MTDTEKDMQELDVDEKAAQEYFETLIPHPFVESVDNYPITMAMAICEGRKYVGGISGISEDFSVSMHAPLVFNENLTGDPKTGEIQHQIAIFPVSFAVGLTDKVLLRPTLIYMFKKSDQADRNATSHYEAKYKKMMLAQSGLVAPTNEDIANITRPNFGNGSR